MFTAKRLAPFIGNICKQSLFIFFITACGGGVPLLHPAQTLHPGATSLGAGTSAEIPFTNSSPDTAELEDLTVAPALSPWVAGRVGIRGDNEAGLTYTGRTLRMDARHAFSLHVITLSAGLGASAIVAKRLDSSDSNNATSIYGGGIDLPLLLGVRSRSDIYSIWIGPRVGIERMEGVLSQPTDEPDFPELVPVDATHYYGGGLVGFRLGFRHIYGAMEVEVDYHSVSGSIDNSSVNLNQFTVRPAAALVATF